MKITVTNDAHLMAAEFNRLQVEVPSRVAVVTYRGAVILKSMIQANAPVRTGRYKASIRIEKDWVGSFYFQAEIGSDLDYGRMLEFGGVQTLPNGKKVRRSPRPHFRPAINEFEPAFVASLRNVLT